MPVPAGAREVFTDGGVLAQPRPRWLGLGRGHLGLRLRLRAGHDQPADGDPAAFEAVRALDGPLLVVSDSTYVVNCFRDEWWRGWLQRGWTNSARQPVANRDLWEPFVELVAARGDVAFAWVKGHSGHPMNDFVDRLAVAACRDGA